MFTYIRIVCYFHLFICLSSRPLSDSSLSNACGIVANWLQTNIPILKKIEGSKEETTAAASILLGDHYDVFISYSHMNSEVAHEIKRHLSICHPDWKIFIDVADLKTGVVWQTKLYNSIGETLIFSIFSYVGYFTDRNGYTRI